jgi:CheY-like chemotaxis protein
MPLQGLRVLVVEDEGPIALMIEDMLQDMGCVVVGSAASVGEAQKLVAHGGFDFALLDMNLGGAKGESVADALAAAKIPFVFASGYGLAGVPPHLQGRPVLPKPFLISDLRRLMLESLAVGPV